MCADVEFVEMTRSAKLLQAGLDFGAATLKMSCMELTLNSRLTMIQLPDADGHETRLGSLWLRQPAVIVFLRHYG